MDTIPLDIVGVIADQCDYISRVCFSMTCWRMRRKIKFTSKNSVLLADGRLRRVLVVGCGQSYPTTNHMRRREVTLQPKFAGPLHVYIREGEFVLEFDDTPKAHPWLYRMSRNDVIIGEILNPKLNNGRRRVTQLPGYRPPIFLVRISEQMGFRRYENYHLQNIADMLEFTGGIAHRAWIRQKIDRVKGVVVSRDRDRRPQPDDNTIPAQDL